MLRNSFCIFFDIFSAYLVCTSVHIMLYIKICVSISVRIEDAPLTIEVRRDGLRGGDRGFETNPQ